MRNQFSFWPRYDEFTLLPPESARDPNEVYTEEQGVNLFSGRTALFLRPSGRAELPRAIGGGFGRTEQIARIEVRAGGRLLRRLYVYACYDYRTLPL
jgi:hypothetical protein